MQIRYNISHLEQWTRDNHMTDMGIPQALEPIIQASQLLQARKTEQDVDSICDMCTQLSLSQVRLGVAGKKRGNVVWYTAGRDKTGIVKTSM